MLYLSLGIEPDKTSKYFNEIEILQVLKNHTDKEAGDVEWEYADKFGYPRGKHYTESMKALSVGGKKGGAVSSGGTIGGLVGGMLTYKVNFSRQTAEQRVAAGKKGGRIGGAILTFEQLSYAGKMSIAKSTHQQRVEWGKLGGSKGGTARAFNLSSKEIKSISSKAGKVGGLVSAYQKYKCLECGWISNPGGLGMHQKGTGHKGKAKL